MKKASKIIYIALAVIVIVVIVVVAAVGLFADSAVRVAVESAGSKALGVKVELQNVDLSIMGGELGFKNLTIDNPPGYAHDRLLELQEAKIAVKVKSLLSDVVNIKDIKLDGVNIVLEQKGLSSNLQDLINAMPGHAKSESEAEPSGKTLRIDNLEITNVTAKVKLLPVPGKADTVTLELSPIKMTNLGSDEKLDLAKLSGKIVMAIASGIAEQGAGILPKDMVDTMTSTLGKTVDLGKGIVTESEKLLMGTGDAGKGVTEGLKDLLKKGKKE